MEKSMKELLRESYKGDEVIEYIESLERELDKADRINDKYMKALDESCELVNNYVQCDGCPFEDENCNWYHNCYSDKMTKDDWKMWFMKELPISFFENLKTQKNAKVENDEVVPFRFSEKVLKGEDKVKATLPNKINKFQESLDNMIIWSCPKDLSCGECDFEKSCKFEEKEYINTLQELVDNYGKLMNAFDDGKVLYKQDTVNGVGIFECEADVWATIGDPIVKLKGDD